MPIRSLHDNRIAYVQDGTFVGLSSLSSLNLLNNPLDCSCPSRWMSAFFAGNSALLTGNPVCTSPTNLKQIPVQDVLPADFNCPADEQTLMRVQQTCGLPLCPVGCECNGNGLVRCSNAGLTQPPAHLEVGTRELYLDRNKIRELNARLQPLSQLEKLDLSNNELLVLTDRSFANLTRLHTLILSYNRIRCIEMQAFYGLTRLRMLSLHSNNLSGISDGVFAPLIAIRHVALGANPFYCDCRLRWLANWLRGDFNEPGIARCFAPDTMADRLLVSAPPSEFVCSKPTPNEVLAKCDPCFASPCANGGVCHRPGSVFATSTKTGRSLDQMAADQADPERSLFADDFDATDDEWSSLPKQSFRLPSPTSSTNNWKSIEDDSYTTIVAPPSSELSSISSVNQSAVTFRSLADALNFTCECAPGFYGARCEQSIDACFGAPCENGGRCRVLGEGQFECECEPGYAGQLCEQNVDDCVQNECINDSRCVDLVNSYRCECSDHYTGKYCENRIHYCSRDFNPCLNDARCVPLMPTIKANASNPITMVSASLNDSLAIGYSCECDLGFTGKHCETNVDDCARHLCQNGARCVDGRNSYSCQCPDGFSGVFCEQGGPQVELQQQQPHSSSPTCGPTDCVYGVCLQTGLESNGSIGSGPDTAQCACTAGYSGLKCDRLTTISVFERAYVELASPVNSWRTINITFTLWTRAERGVLLYAHTETDDAATQSDKKRKAQPHLAVELYKGRLRISWMLGVHPVSTMFSFELLNDARPHRVRLQVIGRRVGLAIDAGSTRWITSDGGNDELQRVQRVWYGGMDLTAAQQAQRARHVWTSDSFVGCLKNLEFNGITLDLRSARRQQRVSAGCSKFERSAYGGSNKRNAQQAKQRRLPGNSRATAAASSSSFSASTSLIALQADGPETDRFVESQKWPDASLNEAIESSTPSVVKNSDGCHRRLFVDVVREGDCVSSRKWKQARCVPGDLCAADDGCCRTVKSRHRTVRLHCPDGRSIVKRIALPRKCACTRSCASTKPNISSSDPFSYSAVP